MILALTALLLSAEPPRVIVSSAPVASLAALTVTAMDRYDAAWIPVFIAVPIRDDLTLDLDVETALLSLAGVGANLGWSVKLSAGPTWFPSGGLTGFYIGPRLQFLIGAAANQSFFFPGGACPVCKEGGPLDVGQSVRRSFLVGFDIGWQFRYRALVFGPVLGASAGYSFDSESVFANPFETRDPTVVRRLRDTFAFGLNINLFKLGIAL